MFQMTYKAPLDVTSELQPGAQYDEPPVKGPYECEGWRVSRASSHSALVRGRTAVGSSAQEVWSSTISMNPDTHVGLCSRRPKMPVMPKASVHGGGGEGGGGGGGGLGGGAGGGGAEGESGGGCGLGGGEGCGGSCGGR